MNLAFKETKLDIWPESPRIQGDTVEITAVVELGGQKFHDIWFRLPSQWSSWVTDAADPFVLSTVFVAMARKLSVNVHGSVSPSLLRNLEEFQSAWHRWKPKSYRKIEIVADVETEQSSCGDQFERVLLAFSGGLDSSCTAWRHFNGQNGRRKQNIVAGVMAHGFDIPLSMTDAFERAVTNSEQMLASIGMKLIPVISNFRELNSDWENVHGIALAAILHLLSKNCSSGLIASSHVYERLRFPWGSNPVTDHLLSSKTFSIVYDSADLNRIEKAKTILNWEEGMRRLRVCWIGENKDRNCGNCVRCVGTALCFAALPARIPESLPIVSLEQAINNLSYRELKPAAVAQLIEIRNHAVEAKVSESWLRALERRIQRQQLFFVITPFLLAIKELECRLVRLALRLRNFRRTSVDA